VAVPSRLADDRELLAAAQAGDADAFAALVEPSRRALLVHCYRMLGSPHDAEDAVQDALLRAWRHLDSYEPRAPLEGWLYRIATNVCLSALSRRPREGSEAVEPLPDLLLDPDGESDPAETVERRETVELAFVAAVQMLPPRQRAVLLLRDVLEWPAREVATWLEITPAAVTSALQRARATLSRARAAADRLTNAHEPAPAGVERELALRFADAWNRADLDGLVALMTDDAFLTMPPSPRRVDGREKVAAFLRDVASSGRLDRFRLVPTRANLQPAVALYREDDGDPGRHLAYAMLVLALRGGRVASLVRFGGAERFESFGLPVEYA
jgi:RNA polymerase sigma-70 factor (ECF subfamily)